MRDTLDMSVSQVFSKNGEKYAFVSFTDKDRSAEGRIPDCKITANQGFCDEEVRQLEDYMSRELGFSSEMVGEVSGLDGIEHIFHKLYHAANDSVYGKESCSAFIYEYILEARRLFFSEAAGSAAGIIENAVAYIDKNFREDITLEQLAHISGISLQHFCRVFKAQMGMRPMEYVARRRIAEAKHILDNTEESIEKIGKKSGYPNLSYFGAVFKKYEGISPSEYRKLERRSTSSYQAKDVPH